MKQWMLQVIRTAIDYFLNTSIEILVCLCLFAAIGGILSCRHEAIRGRYIPLAFSEKEAIEDRAAAAKIPVPSVTNYLTTVNDLTMKVFECWNTSHDRNVLFGDNDRFFASELENRMSASLRTHRYEIADLLQRLPAEIDSVLGTLSEFREVLNKLIPVTSRLNDAWDESHSDVYHPEVRTRTYTDSKGNSHTETYIEMVYDYTIHKYTYHAQYGAQAAAWLEDLLSSHGGFDLRQEPLLPTEVHAENEYAIMQSRKELLDPEEIKVLNTRQLASTWYFGATITENVSVIRRNWPALRAINSPLKAASRTAHSTRYTTGSRFDRGPREYQVFKQAQDVSLRVREAIETIFSSISYVSRTQYLLQSSINKFIAISLDQEKGDPDEVSDQVLQTARSMYGATFSNGFVTNQFRVGMVFLWLFVAGGVGSLIGRGWDYLNQRNEGALLTIKEKLQ